MTETSQTHVANPGQSIHCSATFKILLIGDACVGKTSLLCRYVDGEFRHSYVTTVGKLVLTRDISSSSKHMFCAKGIDYKNRVLDVDDMKVKLQIWDTAGQERFRTLTNAYYRGAHGVFIMYDITNRSSFDHVTEWVKSARQHGAVDLQIIIVGHKSDKEEHRTVEQREGRALAEHHSAKFFEASSLTGDNCENLFFAMADDIRNVRETSNANETLRITGNPSSDLSTSKQRSGCC